MQKQGLRRTAKRRFSNEPDSHLQSMAEEYISRHRAKGGSRIIKAPGAHWRTKRARHVPEVVGERLSLDRILESLDKKGLQQLVMNLISEKPELAQEVSSLSPKVTCKDAINTLKGKLQLVNDNMPYKVEPSSDYAFLRVKPFVVDFFQTLSDYTLNYLPPVENDLTVSIQFLLEFLTDVLPRLPHFETVEFRYYHNLTTDKLNTILKDVITQFVGDKKQNILLVINENWLNKFEHVNELNDNHFSTAVELLKQELDAYQNSGAPILEEESEPAQLQGLNSFINFSNENNPLNGAQVSNVYDAI